MIQQTQSAASARRWVSLTEATKYVALSGKTLMKHIRTGEIYGTLKGGKWLIDLTSVDAWLEEDKVRLLNMVRKRQSN